MRRQEFERAARKAAEQLVDDYRANGLLNRVFNNRGHHLMGLFAHYLHHAQLEGESSTGLTVGRFRAVCTRAGIGSAGRATAMLNLMRFAGYLRAVPSPADRRCTLLVPTERLVTIRSRRWRHHLEAMAPVMPEGQIALALWGKPWFEVAFLREAVEGYLGGFRFADHTPRLAHCFENVSGLMILLQVDLAAGGSQQEECATVTISDLASQCGISRAHVRKVLARATQDGLLHRILGSRDPIRTHASLHRAVCRFFAASFAFSARCIRRAIADCPESEALPAIMPSGRD